jgi:hypothetical protein
MSANGQFPMALDNRDPQLFTSIPALAVEDIALQ